MLCKMSGFTCLETQKEITKERISGTFQASKHSATTLSIMK